MRSIGRLHHGGIMVNYRCTAACRHCMYASSPQRTKGYMTPQTAKAISHLLRESGCYSVHIGGGEPFLDFDGLLSLVKVFIQEGITIEYIETNAYWATNSQTIRERLNKLAAAGVDSLCISVDPFHVEYIPIERPLLLAQECQHLGFPYFLWQERFLSLFSSLDPSVPHPRETLEKTLSPDYLWQVARSYGINFHGRALGIEEEYLPKKPLAAVTDSTPCRGLLSSHHFHIDFQGMFIPSCCTGLYIPFAEAVEGVPIGKYPLYDILLNHGVAGLLEYGKSLGFTPDPEGYTSSCALCFYLRHWLCKKGDYAELDDNFYLQSLAYY